MAQTVAPAPGTSGSIRSGVSVNVNSSHRRLPMTPYNQVMRLILSHTYDAFFNQWRHFAGAGMLGGIGFTMSIFIANLAFVGQPADINTSKLAILLASLLAGVIGYAWLWRASRQNSHGGSADS